MLLTSGRKSVLATLAISFTLVAADVPAQTVALSALGSVHPGFRIDGIDGKDSSGFSVSGAGDVNGDGLADLIVGAYLAALSGAVYTGESYVVFGKTDTTPVSLGSLGAGGFQIVGSANYAYSGFSVSGAGDVNGDGLADLIIGAPRTDPNGVVAAGESHLVFGKTDSAAVSLASLGAGGFRIEGIDIADRSGRSVSGAGDVNGDGLSDLIIGAFRGDPNGATEAGESYVVFGKTDSTVVSLAALDSGGFRIDGVDPSDYSGSSVGGAGDVNGDGLGDLIVGAYGGDPNGLYGAGESYVIFGKTGSSPVSLSSLGADGFRIDGIDGGDRSGTGVSGAGDVNGDGLADIVIGAWTADSNGRLYAGQSYVVFGKTGTETVSLALLGAGGFPIDGAPAFAFSGLCVSGAGDTNGDGLADVIVSAHYAAPSGIPLAGESYVVFGKTGSAAVSVESLGAGGFRITGIDANDFSGRSVSGAGDVNGDGLADLIVGAYAADPTGASSAGESYVIFSTATPPASATYKGVSGPGNAPRMAVGVTGDGSNDSTPDSRIWIDFADGAAASTETVILTRNNNGVTNLTGTAEVAWEITSDRTGWTNGRVTFKYLDAEIAGLDEGTIRIFTSGDPSGPWTPLPNITRDAADNTISGDVTSFSYFAIADDAVLSVELGEFTAAVLPGGGTEVRWTTLLEDETAGFFVRRALPDGAGGTTVGDRINTFVIPAEGGGSYSIFDPAGTKDSMYYLEEITVDGGTKYYGPVGATTRNASVGEWMNF